MVNQVHFTTVHTLAQAIRSKQLSAQAVVADYIARIEAIHPSLNALIQLDPTALTQAKEADADLA